MTTSSELKPHRNFRPFSGRKASVCFYYFGCNGNYTELLKLEIQKKWSSHFDFHIKSKALRVVFKYFVNENEEATPISINYDFKIKENDLILSIENAVIHIFENAIQLPIENIMPDIIKKMETSFGAELEKKQDIKLRFKKFISVINKMCKESNVKVEPISLSQISIEEMCADELIIKFDVNGEIIEEPIDFKIEKHRLYMLQEMLKIKSSLKKDDYLGKNADKKRI